MDTIVTLSNGQLAATHYGFYNPLTGIGTTLGSLTTGAAWDAGQAQNAPWLVWAALAGIGATGTTALILLLRTGHLPTTPLQPPPSEAVNVPAPSTFPGLDFTLVIEPMNDDDTQQPRKPRTPIASTVANRSKPHNDPARVPGPARTGCTQAINPYTQHDQHAPTRLAATQNRWSSKRGSHW
ncbi:hypothetical protein [Umezawaea sp. NPDC059074]|uniref:hypothetical protein n=1 Tax=Umezawaea sp. NPDC059074 TaxID=3346716 RepID=UPI00369E6584